MQYEVTAEFYDHIVPYRQRADLEFWIREAQRAKGPVLELACGTGRILISAAQAGVPITGLELAAPMLSVCRRKLAGEPKSVRDRVRLVEGDMREFELEPRSALVMLPFRSFQHLITIEEQLSCLGSVRRHLEPGGRLVLDVFDPDMARITDESVRGVEMGHEPEFTMPDGRRVVRSHRIVDVDLARQQMRIELLHTIRLPDGGEERRVETLRMRYFFRYELEHLLARRGFEVEAIYSDFERTPHGTGRSGELIFVAR